MNPTVRDGDVVVFITVGQISRGDIIAFNHGSQVLVKRVIAISGDYIDIDEGGKVQLNNKYLDEPYISGHLEGKHAQGMPRQIQDNQFFVMGDHRQTSIDSRDPEIGSVRKDQVIGKAFIRLWPINRLGTLN
jgi:signal peptidase I